MHSLLGVGSALAAWLLAGSATLATAAPLNIQLGYADGSQREGLKALVEEFRAGNPDVDVHLTLVEEGAYRKALPGELAGDAAPDVFNWFAGARMRELAQAGALEDLSDLWKANGWWTAYSSTAAAATVAGKQVALPYQLTPWGLFSRRDVLEYVGLHQAPRDLAGLLTACAKLRKAGFVPIALGARDGWPAAAWFDFLDLRTNGYEFHAQLLAGKASYDDGNVRRTFMMWKQLVDAGCFAPDAAGTTAAAAAALVAQGHAGMVLAPTRFAASLPEAVRPLVDYERFPTVDASQAAAEVVPVDTLHVAAHAHAKAEARRFIRFAGTSAAQARFARSTASFPAHNNAAVNGTVFNLAAYKTVEEARTNLVQGFDRDTPEAMVQAGLHGFEEFLARPGQLYAVIGRLDAARATAYPTTVSEDTAAVKKRP